jgi:hypothetical protein
MTSPNIGEARIARDHNIDRKEIALPVAPRSIFVAAAPAGARHRFGGPGSNGLAEGPAAGQAPARLSWDFPDCCEFRLKADSTFP